MVEKHGAVVVDLWMRGFGDLGIWGFGDAGIWGCGDTGANVLFLFGFYPYSK